MLKQNSGKLPINKYLSTATRKFPSCEQSVTGQNFDSMISKTFRKNRNSLGEYKSIAQIWENEKENLERATRWIAYLTEEQMDLDELETVLYTLFEKDVNILKNEKEATRTNIRRLIRIYDYLKWGK